MAIPFLTNVDMNSCSIINLADPVTAQGAATKNYVDSHLWIGPDTHPSSPSAFDDEFESSVLNGKWTVQTDTSNSHDINTTIKGALFVKLNASATPAPQYTISQPYAPAAADIAVTFRASMFPTGNFHTVAAYLADTNTGGTNCVQFGWGWDAGLVRCFMHKRVAGVQTNDIAVSPSFTAGTQCSVYIHLQRKSGTWTFWYSLDGRAWSPMTITGFPSFTVSFLILEIASYSTTSALCHGTIDFVRVNDFYL